MISHNDKIAIHRQTQLRAAEVLHQAVTFIQAGMSEQELVAECAQRLIMQQLTETWYYTVPVLAYVGERSTLSMSGREYRPADVVIQPDDVVTIAFSPKVDECWAAIARTFYLQNGCVVTHLPETSKYFAIDQFQQYLHRELISFARPDLRFDDIYHHFNQLIQSAGYINLDYHGNLGHSLETDLSRRRFIEQGSTTLLGDCDIFAFETHVGKQDQCYGSKHENIYYFNNGKLVAVPMDMTP